MKESMKSEWNTYRLEDLCTFHNGLWKGKKPPYIKVGVIRNTNFTKEGILDTTDIPTLDVEEKQYKTRKLQYGDIILEKSGGGPKQPVGRVVIFDLDQGEYSLSNFTSAIRIKDKERLSFQYLHKYLQYFYITGNTENMQSHSTGIRNLDFTRYKSIQVPVPPIEEQKRIVSILDDVFTDADRAINIATKTILLNNALFETYIRNVFNGTASTERVQLGDLLEKTETYNPTRKPNEKFKYVDISCIDNKNFAITSPVEILGGNAPSRARKLIKKGDIIYATVRPTLKRVAIVGEELDNQVCSTGFCVLRPKVNINPKLVYFLLISDYFKSKIEPLQKGASYPAITDTDIKKQLISTFPTKLKQEDIAERIEQVFNNTKKLTEIQTTRINNMMKLKKSVLNKAFGGEL